MRYRVWQPQIGNHWRVFDEVATCLVGALKDLGHGAEASRPKNDGAQHIVLAPHMLVGRKIPEGGILYNLEQASPESGWFKGGQYVELLRRHRVWDYSEKNAAALRALGVAVETVVPVAYHEALDGLIAQDAVKTVDVAFVGSTNDRRLKLLNACRALGLSVEVGFGVYGQERNELYARARVVLNAHFYESNVFEAVRVLPLLANGVAVATEGGDAEGERPYAAGMLVGSIDALPGIVSELKRRTSRRCGLQARAVEAAKSIRLVDSIRAALSA